MSDDISFVLNHYPSLRDHIIAVYKVNEEFRTVCEDLHAISKTLERYHSKISKDLRAELEYHKLRLELEAEFLNILEQEYDGTRPSDNKETD